MKISKNKLNKYCHLIKRKEKCKTVYFNQKVKRTYLLLQIKFKGIHARKVLLNSKKLKSGEI